MTWQFKDPDEVLDYQVDWSTALGGDTIASSVWTLPSGITQDSSTLNDTATTIWLSGGTDGSRYDLTNRITTAAGRTFEQHVSIFVRADGLAAALDATVAGASSDSYVTEIEYLDYARKRGWSVTTGQEANLRAATVYLDTYYTWLGLRVATDQALRWPRSNVGYIDGGYVSHTTIPQPIKDAQCEMAYLLSQGATPFATLEGGKVERKREKVDVIEEETVYSAGREMAAYPLIDRLVSEYAASKAGVSAGSFELARS